MLTAFDKVLASILTTGLLALNHKYGFNFSTDPATIAALDGLIMSAVIYFVPNKTPAAPAAPTTK
jgi:hypothetical protein